jgi:NADH-quinone oxidoreductase subunit G
MGKDVTLTIDNQSVTVPENTLVVDAAKQVGIDIPVFCYHPKMEPVGMCRMCLVEVGRPMMDRATGKPVLNEDGTPRIQFAPKLETSCTVPVAEGMVIRTNTEPVVAAHKEVVEFLLTSHPLDCPICDKGGECPLQNLTRAWGPGSSRFLLDNKIHLAKHVPLGELIYLDRERCIQCARCTRFQAELVDEPVIGFYHRGRALEIVTYSDPPFNSYFSGNTTDICPVGALTSADFRFAARPWELKHSASICTQCPVGCNTTLDSRREAKAGGRTVIKRVMPRQNELVNEIWICDKGRFGYHYADSQDRIETPMIRKENGLVPVSWTEALDLVEQRFRLAGGELVTLVGERLSNEDYFNIAQVTRKAGGQAVLHSRMGGGEAVQRFGLGVGTNFKDMGPDTAILVVASDLQEEAPVWWLRVKQAADRGAKLIVLNPRPTRLTPYAAHNITYAYGQELAALMAFLDLETAPETVRPAIEAFKAAQNHVVIYGSEGIGYEMTAALARAAADLLIQHGYAGQPNNGLLAVWPHNNTQGAWDMGFRPLAADLPAALGGARLAWMVGADPAGDDPALAAAVDQANFVIVQELFLTATAQMADVVLPALAFTERDGTYTSGERRVQRFYPAEPEPLGPMADYAIAGKIGQRLGLQLESPSPVGVMARIAESVPAYAGLTYPKISRVEDQWPIIGRADLYYGGTQYENKQGLGVKLPPDSVLGAQPPLADLLKPPVLTVPAGALLIVPVTRLYDQGITLQASQHLLHNRTARREVWLNSQTAAGLGLKAADLTVLDGDGWTANGVEVRLNDDVPAGVALAPRSVGIPLNGPAAVRIRPLVSEPEA